MEDRGDDGEVLIAARYWPARVQQRVLAELLAKCQEPGASIGGVAIAHGLHPNMLHRLDQGGLTGVRAEWPHDAEPPTAFVPIPLAAVSPDGDQ